MSPPGALRWPRAGAVGLRNSRLRKRGNQRDVLLLGETELHHAGESLLESHIHDLVVFNRRMCPL